MKKKISGSIAAIVIAGVATFNVNFNTNTTNGLSAINLNNVEALAQENTSGSESILISEIGSGTACIANEVNNTVTYSAKCFGSGSIACTGGTFTVYTPTGGRCGDV